MEVLRRKSTSQINISWGIQSRWVNEWRFKSHPCCVGNKKGLWYSWIMKFFLCVIYWVPGQRHLLKPSIFYHLIYLTSFGTIFILSLTLMTVTPLNTHSKKKKREKERNAWLCQSNITSTPQYTYMIIGTFYSQGSVRSVSWLPLGYNLSCIFSLFITHSCCILENLCSLCIPGSLKHTAPSGFLHFLLSLPPDILQVGPQYNVSSKRCISSP